MLQQTAHLQCRVMVPGCSVATVFRVGNEHHVPNESDEHLQSLIVSIRKVLKVRQWLMAHRHENCQSISVGELCFDSMMNVFDIPGVTILRWHRHQDQHPHCTGSSTMTWTGTGAGGHGTSGPHPHKRSHLYDKVCLDQKDNS